MNSPDTQCSQGIPLMNVEGDSHNQGPVDERGNDGEYHDRPKKYEWLWSRIREFSRWWSDNISVVAVVLAIVFGIWLTSAVQSTSDEANAIARRTAAAAEMANVISQRSTVAAETANRLAIYSACQAEAIKNTTYCDAIELPGVGLPASPPESHPPASPENPDTAFSQYSQEFKQLLALDNMLSPLLQARIELGQKLQALVSNDTNPTSSEFQHIAKSMTASDKEIFKVLKVLEGHKPVPKGQSSPVWDWILKSMLMLMFVLIWVYLVFIVLSSKIISTLGEGNFDKLVFGIIMGLLALTLSLSIIMWIIDL